MADIDGCIKQNRYKYSFGRQANRTLANLELPDRIPSYVYGYDMGKYDHIQEPIVDLEEKLGMDVSNWKIFKYSDLFELGTGGGVLLGKARKNPGDNPVVSATRLNNAVAAKTSLPPSYPANSIAIIKNGVNVGQAYFQEKDYLITTDVAVLIPKFSINKYIAVFITTVITLDSYRYNYGRKWGKSSFDNSTVKLPINTFGELDLEYMETFIKAMKYSSSM